MQTIPAADWRARGNDTNPPGPGAGEPVKNMLTRSGGDLEASERAAAPNNNNGRTSGKKTKKRTVRRKRTYKKSKKSYKKSKKSYKGKWSVKRGGATALITFNIVKGNGLNQLFEVELNPNETGKDLYDRVNQRLEQNPAYLTDDERAGERKLVTDNDTPVNYADILSSFQSPTTIILSINPRQNAAANAALAARLIELQNMMN